MVVHAVEVKARQSTIEIRYNVMLVLWDLEIILLLV